MSDKVVIEELEEHLAYWRRQLGGALPTLELPTDQPRPSTRSFRGARHTHELPPSLTEGLRALSQQEGATLFMTLVAGFQALLHRYSGQDDILLGSPIASRAQAELGEPIAFFANSLVLRTDMSGNPSFRELLGRVRKVTLEAYAHQDAPFEKLVEELQPERDPSRDPIFQVFLGLQNASISDQRLPAPVKHAEESSNGTTKFDINLTIEETETTLRVRMEYSTDLFEPETIARMQRHYQTLLEGAVADPARRLSDLPLLTSEEREQLLVEWNATQQDYPLEMCIHELVEAQAERTPDAVAVADGDRHLSYRELNNRANQLAHHLQAQGIGPEVQVGVLVERSLELVVGILGVVKAGGAYVPLDPAYPDERLAFMLDDAQVRVLITSKDDGRWTMDDGLQSDTNIVYRLSSIVYLDADWPQIARQPASSPITAVGPTNLAYVIYTSGSTGTPKGAMNTHRGIVNRLRWMQDTYRLRADDRVLQKTPISFDVSVWEFFWPLLSGAQLVLAQPGGQQDPTYLAELIARAQITTLHFVPPMLQAFLDLPDLTGCGSLRRVICSGEALPIELQRRFFARLAAELHNLYGPTEAAIDVTAWACDRATTQLGVPIGRPIANTQIYLLDQHMQLVPVGVHGELYIGGVQLARGYLKRPDLTAERFVPNPFGDFGFWILDFGLKKAGRFLALHRVYPGGNND